MTASNGLPLNQRMPEFPVPKRRSSDLGAAQHAQDAPSWGVFFCMEKRRRSGARGDRTGGSSLRGRRRRARVRFYYGAGAECVVVSASLFAVVVRSVLLGLNTIRAPTMNTIAPRATDTLQPEPVSSNGILRSSGKGSSYGVIRGKFGSYVMAFPPS